MTQTMLEAAHQLLASSLRQLQMAAPTSDSALLAAHCCLEALMVVEDARRVGADVTPIDATRHAIRLLRDSRSPQAMMLVRNLRVIAGTGEIR